MKSAAQRTAADMFRSLVRGDPRDVFPCIKAQVMYDFECAYKSGVDGSPQEFMPEYELSARDRHKLHLLVVESFNAGKQAQEIVNLRNQITLQEGGAA